MQALVGFSVNAEIVQTFNRMTEAEKGELKSIKCDLCGTSANVARALNKLGQQSKVLALTGINNDFESHILRYALKDHAIPFEEFRILDHSHISVYPIDGLPTQKIFGSKGEIISSMIPSMITEIKDLESSWRIATGVRTPEIPFIESFFESNFGYRTLNPRVELIENKKVFFELLKKTDCLIVNHAEYDACKVASVSEIHNLGPRIVIVTQNKYGGWFSVKGNEVERFDPCIDYINGKIFEVGSGDWFSGGFHTFCMEINKSIFELDLTETRDAILFGARVSGKKITMQGAANGPSKEDL